MNKTINVLGKILNICSIFSGYVTLAVGLFVAVAVLSRFLGNTIKGDSEIVCNMMTIVIFFAIGYSAFRKGHIKMDIIKAWPFLDHVWVVVELIAMIILAYASFVAMNSALKSGVSSSLLRIIKWPFIGLTGVGFLMMFVGVLCSELQDIVNKKQGSPALSQSAEGSEYYE